MLEKTSKSVLLLLKKSTKVLLYYYLKTSSNSDFILDFIKLLFIIIIITFQSLPGGPVEPAASDKHSVGRSPADDILNTIG